MPYCIRCGGKLVEGARFCHMCGTPVSTDDRSSQSTRRQEYAGVILKCSNCGAIISETTVICPECGMRITGRNAVSSVEKFKDQLMQIEANRKKNRLRDVYSMSANPADTQKLTLIRSFPIPNTIDDIQEFILLAIANIDSKLSKHSVAGAFTRSINSGNINLSMQETISEAWISKMQQAYQKAKISFPDDPSFVDLQKLYFEKLKELKMKE